MVPLGIVRKRSFSRQRTPALVAGFDMQYADKLLGVFQRLLTVDAFVDSSIGLAMIKRIESRHGARISAEDKLEEGSSLYFSLPTNGVTLRGT
jgi:light-regulated signal transduction histidine kinase (bacteriophytochrome)